MKTHHLKDEQFEQLLAGNPADPAAAAHLDDCAECRNELDSIRSAVGDLRDLSLLWAEQRGTRIHAPSPWTLRWHTAPRWSVAAAALLLIGIGIGLRDHQVNEQNTAAQISRYEPAPAPSADELAQDNQLLQSIDDELHQQIRPQVPVSDLGGSSHSVRRSPSREILN